MLATSPLLGIANMLGEPFLCEERLGVSDPIYS